MKRVLISAPTSKDKNYCFEKWLENTMSFYYPEYEVALFDNTLDNGENTEFLNKTFKKLYGNSTQFKAFHSRVENIESVIQRMAISSNDCRDYFLQNSYDKFFSLETDVFPPRDTIEKLMFHNKKVVGALYYRDEGNYRKLMVQKHIKRSHNNIVDINVTHNEDAYIIDGGVKKVASVGLGAVLIDKEVLKKIPFRFEEGNNLLPDSHFSKDCYLKGFSIFADTSIICKHDNKNWGLYGVDFK